MLSAALGNSDLIAKIILLPEADLRSWAPILLATFIEWRDHNRCEWIFDGVFRECHNLCGYKC